MAVNLTETAISAAEARAKSTKKRVELVDKGHAGLRLRVTPSGGKSWVLACRDPHGRMRRFPLGNHPKMGVADARNTARTTWAEVRKGSDPVAEARHKRAMAKAAKEGIGTLEALLNLYGKKDGAALKSWPESRRRIDSVFKPFLKPPLGTLKARDFQLQADTWPSAQSAAAAVRYIRPVLKWAATSARRYVPVELADLSPPAAPGRRERILSRDELESLLPVLKASNRPYAGCMLLMLYTLVRREEAAGAYWRDVDLKTGIWTIAETKNGQPHVVPLPKQAVALLSSLQPKNAKGESAAKPGDLVFATSTGNPLGNWDRETKALQLTSKTAGWQRHDLRRTGATMLGEMGELPDIIEAALNHVSIHSQLAATYNRSRYRPQVASALQRLADALDGIEAGAATILQLHGAGTAA